MAKAHEYALLLVPVVLVGILVLGKSGGPVGALTTVLSAAKDEMEPNQTPKTPQPSQLPSQTAPTPGSPAPDAIASNSATAVSSNNASGITISAAHDLPPEQVLKIRLEEASARFRNLRAVYHPLHVLPYGRPTLFNLTIASADLKAARAQASRFDQLNGAVGENQKEQITTPIPLGDRVEAVLDGAPSDVEIAIQGPHDPDTVNGRTKDVTDAANVSWVWSVKPKTMDDVSLTLHLYNMVSVNGVDHSLDGPVYTDTFKVNATISERVRAWVSTWDPVWTAIAGVIAAVFGATVAVFGRRWWRRRESSRQAVRPQKVADFSDL